MELKNDYAYSLERDYTHSLNMVVGANGTGKSTILNAICLGLGGEPKILGRADDLRAFIMHNESQASIEITLQGHEDDVVVLKRIIDRNKGSEKGRGRGASTFYINNEKCNIQKVRELVTSRFHIAIDNLCTFLPQDKVGAFSGFTDQERLIETEKTLPTDQWFYKTHMDLIEKEEAMEQNVNNVESIEDELKKKQREFEKIEINKRHEEQRLEAERQLDLLQKKKMWVVFENQRAQCLALKERKQQLRQQLREANAAVQPLVERHEHLLAQKKELEKLSSTADNHIQKSKKELEKQKTKFEKHDDAIENTLADLFEIDSKRDKLVKNLAEARSRLEEIQEALNSCPEDIETATTNWNNQRNRWNTVKKDFENAKREYRHCQAQYQEREEKAGMLQTKLAKFNDEGARRRERILRDMPDLGRICEFIERKRSIFRKNIFGPVAVEVTVKRSQNAAAYLEYHVPARIWKAFVVETKEDSDRLYQEIRKELGIPINILCVEGKQLDRSRIYSDAKMNVLKKEHGIIGFLDESFTAPDPVMVALQIHAGVHKVLVGNEKTQVSVNQKNLRGFLSEPDSALNQNGLQGSYVFACEGPKSYRYVQSISRFSRKMNSTEDEVGPARMLAPGVSEEQIQQVTNELEEVHSQLNEIRPSLVQSNEHVKNMEKQAQDAHLRVEDAKKRVEHINKYKVKLERQTERVRGAEDALKTDDAAEKDNLLRGLFARLGHSLTAVRTHLEQQDVMRKQTKESAGATVQKLVINTAERAAK
jgi:chromosome segregation ATPase